MLKELFKEVISIVPQWENIPNGTKFKGSISGVQAEGRIFKEHGTIYLCQNVRSGSEGSTTLGYTHSYSVGEGSSSNITGNEVIFDSFELDPTFSDSLPVTVEVGDYNCKFFNGFIKVGCTKVDNALVRDIASKLIDAEVGK